MDEPDRRTTLLAALLTAQAIVSLGAFLVVLLVGLDTVLFLAPVDWGLGLLINPQTSLALASFFYLVGTAMFLAAAHHVRNASANAHLWVFLAALAGLGQLPAGLVGSIYGVLLARRADFQERLHQTPALAGKALRRIILAWTLASSAGILLGAVGVALLFGPTAPIGLALILLGTLPQAGLLRVLDQRFKDGTDALLPAMPALPELSQES